jgi:hypothetical protein
MILRDLAVLSRHTGLVVAIAVIARSTPRAIAHAVLITVALTHPDRKRRAEAIELLGMMNRTQRPSTRDD